MQENILEILRNFIIFLPDSMYALVFFTLKISVKEVVENVMDLMKFKLHTYLKVKRRTNTLLSLQDLAYLRNHTSN